MNAKKDIIVVMKVHKTNMNKGKDATIARPHSNNVNNGFSARYSPSLFKTFNI